MNMGRKYRAGALLVAVLSLCFASLGQVRFADLTSRQNQLDRSRRQLQLQQQLNQERFRAEHRWELHPRPQAPWEERQREYQLQKEFQRK